MTNKRRRKVDKEAIEDAFIQWHQEMLTTDELLLILSICIEDDHLRRMAVDHVTEMEAEAWMLAL